MIFDVLIALGQEVSIAKGAHQVSLLIRNSAAGQCRLERMKMRDNPNMESFYEENSAELSGQTPTITNGGGGGGNGGNMKRPLTLDLGKDLHPAKRLRFNNNTSVISTPDLQMLKMVSPELEKFIMNGNPMATPTPGLTYQPKEVSSVRLCS